MAVHNCGSLSTNRAGDCIYYHVLVTQTSFSPSCSGQGQWQSNATQQQQTGVITDPNQIVLPGGTCTCQKGFYGGNCQFTNECETDQECGTSGTCGNVTGISFPRKMCFCKDTYFGPKCAKSSWVLRLQIDWYRLVYSITRWSYSLREESLLGFNNFQGLLKSSQQPEKKIRMCTFGTQQLS